MLLRQAGLTVTYPDLKANKYSVWCRCSDQIKHDKQEITICSANAPPVLILWLGYHKSIKRVASGVALVLTDFNKSLLMNCVELLLTNQQKQKQANQIKVQMHTWPMM